MQFTIRAMPLDTTIPVVTAPVIAATAFSPTRIDVSMSVIATGGIPAYTYDLDGSPDGLAFSSIAVSAVFPYSDSGLSATQLKYYRARARDSAGVYGSYSAVVNATTPAIDTTPNAFSFTDQTGAGLSAVVTSAAVTVSGINSPATITIVGGTYDINGSGSFTSSPGAVSSGDTVRARVTCSASNLTSVNTTVTIGGVSDTFTATTLAASGGGQLAAGHWVPAKMPMGAVFPRPDSETGAYAGTVYARNRWAYYDGANSVRYEMPVCIQGGARPLMFSVTAGPPGMTVGANYGDSGYSTVTWTPNAAISSGSPTTCTVRVTDQDGSTLDVTWTVATSSSTAQFVFVSPSGNDSTGTGAIGAPFLALAKTIGATSTTTTYPGRMVYMRNGSYAWTSHSDLTGADGGSALLDRARQPVVYLSYPDEAVAISMTGGQIHDAAATDLYFGGTPSSPLTLNGSSATSLEAHTFRMHTANRCTWWYLDFVAPTSRVAGNYTNSTSIMGTNSAIKDYWALSHCSESGRISDGNNDMLLVCAFSVQHAVMEFCRAIGPALCGPFFKDSNRFCTVAYPVIDLQPNAFSSGNAFLFGCQANLQSSHSLEVCYGWIRGGALKLDFQAVAGAGAQWSYRNTIYRTDTNEPQGVIQNGGVGPYTSENDVIITRGTAVVGSGITVTGAEAHKSWVGAGSPPGSDPPFNTTTGALINGSTAWRTLYLGTRGYEIA